jgi:glucose-1-phosphate adenylyltransferase
MKKECVTMLLAGGVGKRLGKLTSNIAKPAVPFGGKYRIIDFALSNCMQSNMTPVGVVTQYQAHTIHQHIGSGNAWGFNHSKNKLTLLSPFTNVNGGEWYEGTADAITKNIDYIDQFQPEYVLILSGDHIYHMDYNKLIAHHKNMQADVTISAIHVPWEDTRRFGIIHRNTQFEITEFEEKPMHAKSNLASMGIYVFNWDILKEYLNKDNENINSNHDFGKDILPKMLQQNKKLYVFPFQGYWKDVGTIESYWEAHMELLDGEFTEFNQDSHLFTYTQNLDFPPHQIMEGGHVTKSIVNDGCTVAGIIQNSVLFENVHVNKYSTISQSVIHQGATIGQYVDLERVIIQENVIIPDYTSIKVPVTEEPLILTNEYILAEQKVGGLNI